MIGKLVDTRTIQASDRKMYHYGPNEVEAIADDAGIVADVVRVHENPSMTGVEGNLMTHWSSKLHRRGQPEDGLVVYHSLGSRYCYTAGSDLATRPKTPTPGSTIYTVMSEILSLEVHLGTWDPVESVAEEFQMDTEDARMLWATVGKQRDGLLGLFGPDNYDRLRAQVLAYEGEDYRPDPMAHGIGAR